MKLLKKNVSVILCLAVLTAAGCRDYHELTEEPLDSGEADFSTYVAVGNSLTAGYRSAALFESGQEFSFPNLLARQFRVAESFSQPLISDPGISPGGGRLVLASLDPPIVVRGDEHGVPINQDEKPFNNLGIPGAILADYVNLGNRPAVNPFYSIVLQQAVLTSQNPSIHKQVKKLNPTFITFWLGNNDVLGYVIAGGEGPPITPVTTFTQLYQQSAQKLSSTGADVVVYNIPNVTNIPYVFLLRTQLVQQHVIVFNSDTKNYELAPLDGKLDIYINVDGQAKLLRKDDFILLSAQTYFAKVAAGTIPPPVSPQTAIPDPLILDGNVATAPLDSELEEVLYHIQAYNTIIQTVADNSKFALVDINKIFSDIFNNFVTRNQENGDCDGHCSNGLVLQPVPASLISLDSAHPTSRGYAVIANETIDVINSFYGANVPLIDISAIPEGIPVISAP